MNFLSVAAALWTATLPLLAQEVVTTEWDVEIPGPIKDGHPSEQEQQPELIDFKVLISNTRRMEVSESPEMPDLPPVKGTINVTVQMVEEPSLPAPPPPLPVTAPDDPAVIARMKELRKNFRGTELIFVSATVYDHSYTFVRIYPNGRLGAGISAWTNIDLNHFSGWSTYRVKDIDGTYYDYGLLMGIGNADTQRMRNRTKGRGFDYDEAEIPELPDIAVSGPSFVVVEGETKGEAMDTLSQIHDLYRKEGGRLEAAFHAREEACAERKAYLLANPPIPEDIVIRFWKRDEPKGK